MMGNIDGMVASAISCVHATMAWHTVEMLGGGGVTTLVSKMANPYEFSRRIVHSTY